ncbi:hypothetical protein M1494_00445 [Candidatus Parvarchaeota archaeon]|nr:hypothetical protein [Candidatus Parvarchaeota archaeon]
MDKRKAFVEVLMVCFIVLFSFLIIHRGTAVLSSSSISSQTAVSLQATIATFSSNPLPSIISNNGNSGSSSLINNNEYVSSSSIYSNDNFWFNEKFYPGNVSFSSSGYSCSAVNELIAPHLCLSLFTFFSCGGGATVSNFTNLVGYLGFPQGDSGFPNSGGTNYSNLYSAISNGTSQNVYQLPSSEFPYQNFINWSSSTIHPYSSLSNGITSYIYAINNSFTGYTNLAGSIPKSTLIIPAVSCGSTFINNYVDYPGFVGTLYNISTLSGFTPSVFLASPDENGFGAYYSYGHILSLGNDPWVGSFNSLLAYQIQSISPAFNYTMPSVDYAQFPKGNKGDVQYLNVSMSFLTPLSMSYYDTGNSSSVEIYVSNKGISALANVSSSQTICVEMGAHGSCLRYGQEVITSQSADTFTSPDLEGAYYPNYANGIYVEFRTDGIFPVCAWNSTIDNTLSSCTFENPATINNISYERLWLSNNLKNNQLYDTTFTPGYSNSSNENNFTLTALDSFCFYGESFNTNNGVYTSPSYTRIIPPTTLENYTSAIGTCNAFFNNTNCFSNSASEYLNFQDGIFASNIKCTSTGIHAENVTDAWINSIYVANNAGDYCGSFNGQKDPSNPAANSTIFLQNISTNCPEFNSNSSSVNLVITVKNVGNTNINNPYLVVLYGNNNLSNIFYNSQNNQEVTYGLYQDFLSSMSATTGIIQVDYNNNFDTNMYVFDGGYPLNPIPIESLFSAGQGYENGPFNNSLLGMWMYDTGEGLPNNVIRTSNTLLVHSGSGNLNVPVIEPNGTATFTLQVPMSLFEALLSGKYNISVFFGNSFNVTWDNKSSPQSTLSNPGTQVIVNPLVSSSTNNPSEIHNNEILTNGSGAISPIWQYIVSYSFNLSKSPMKGVGVYNDNLSINVNSVNSTSNALNVTVNPSVSVLNGSGSYKLNLNQLKGSSISCFVSPDNVQDFAVFWSKQIVSPSNLNYALSNSLYSGNAKQASDVLITSWTGILFMPYSDEVALDYNNLPQYAPALSSFQIEKPTLNQTSGNFNYESFAYFGSGSESSILSSISSLYSSLNSSVSSFSVSLPNSSLAFNILSNNIASDPSLLRVVGTDTLVNYSSFSNKSFTFSLITNGVVQCSYSESTSVNATFESGSSLSSCLGNAVTNHSYINISSKYGPFFVDMYNNSNLNMSNETYDGTVLMAGNETLSKPSKNGLFMITLPINTTTNNGISLVFSVVPLSRQLYNSTLYLYNINGTPFNCNIVNSYNNTGNLGVTKIGNGEYFLPNGTIMCDLNSDFTYLRAVFMNKSNGAYLGSGDIESGLSIQNISKKGNDFLNISINGVPINTQDINIIPDSSTCTAVNDKAVYNGLVQYNSGCNLSDALITFDYNDNGSLITESAFISPKNYNLNSKTFLFMEASAISDAPIAEYTLNVPNNGIENEPIQFVLSNNFGGCNNIRLVTQSPYPYAEVPYQVISSSPQSCDYVFVGYGGNKYSVFESDTPSITYNSNWLDYNSTQYNVQLSNDLFSADLISNCQSGFGPCVDSFSVGGKTLGNLLFNNVSTSSATISPTLIGPVEDCFTVSYSSSQTVEFPETGFGSINYANNKIYQTATPSQAISSMYCFYADSPVITDSISAQGSPIDFKVQNQLISNFSYLQASNLNAFYVPPAINVGYSSYSNVNVSTLNPVYYNVTTIDNILTKCINYTYINSNLTDLSIGKITAINISSANILTPEKLYCVYGGTPSYTTEFSFSSTNNANSSSSVGFAYQPGNYTNGIGTLYESCQIPSGLAMSSSPIFYLNGKEEPYSPSNSGENYIINHSASNSGLEMLYSSSGGVFINSCSTNSTILSYSTCTKPVSVIPSNGSYDSIEAIPTGSNGNLSFGGGCYIGALNGVSYSCSPTDGAINYHLASKSASSLSVSVSKIIINSTAAPTSTFSPSFDCSVNATNSSKFQLASCSYPNNPSSGLCSASVSYKQINSTAYNITAECSTVSTNSFKVVSAVSKISNLNINGSQSETTGLISDYICGNETNVIDNNVLNGWSWKAYSTTGSINPVTTTNPAGIAEIGGCEAGRDTFVTANPNITLQKNGNSFQEFYSCESGYTGTITACSQKTSLPSILNSNSLNTNCAYTNTTLINTTVKTTTVNGNGTGGQATSCNPFNKAGYLQPTVQDNCIAYHDPVTASVTASYELQYVNSSNLGIGMGIIGNSYNLNVSIPNSKQQNSVKDAYLTGLSESQIEGPNNILTDILPTSLLESNLPSKALSISAAYSYDMLNLLMLQNPSLGVSGIPGFINGSVFDYALSLFTGGTSGNCAPPYNVSGDGIFRLGEGTLCSGQTLPASYKEGVFLSLGTLNEGLHSLQFYSIGNSTNEAQPSVSVFDSVGNAVNLNSACSNGNSRVFTSTYSGGKWSINITSDQQCNPINNQLYGYIVNCLYQTPGNETYTISSQYYLAYNLPTIWNISYTLLVSPKSYQVVPTPVYQINYSTGSILTLQQPNKTIFIEKGLPAGYRWYLEYNGVNRSSSNSSLYFYSNGKNSFKAYTLSNTSKTSDCYTVYNPAPSSGSATSGTTTYIQFTGITSCYTYFKQSGLPAGLNWNVTYNNILGSTSMIKPSISNSGGSASSNSNLGIEFITSNPGGFGGNFSFYVSDVKTTSAACTQVYEPSPSSGYLLAGANESVTFSFSSDTCVTTFTESGLFSRHSWSVDYNGTTKTSTINNIEFTTGPGSLPYTISAPSNSSNGCTESYTATPSSGSLQAGQSLSISFSHDIYCITTFTESGLPSGYKWQVIFNGNTESSTGSTITFNTSAGSFSWSASAPSSSSSSCTTTYSPTSGSDTAGKPVSVLFSSSILCTTTFYQSGGIGLTWQVTYDGITKSASTGSSISIEAAPGSHTATASIPGYTCSTNSATVSAGSSFSFNPWSCTSNFYIESGSPLPSNDYDETVTYNGNSQTQNWGNNRVTLPNGLTGLDFTYSSLSNPGSSLLWSVNSPITGICGDSGAFSQYVWTADQSSGYLSPGLNTYIYYSVSTQTCYYV